MTYRNWSQRLPAAPYVTAPPAAAGGAYRNWSSRAPGIPAAGDYISGTNRIGYLGADILAATNGGDHGAGIFVNDQPDPQRWYRALLEESTFPPGALRIRERGDGSFTAVGTAVVGIYVDGARIGASTLVGSWSAVLVGMAVEQLAASPGGAVSQTHALLGAEAVQAGTSGTGAVILAAPAPTPAPAPVSGGTPVVAVPVRQYSVVARRGLSAKVSVIGPKAPAETLRVRFDFGRLADSISTPLVTSWRYAGAGGVGGVELVGAATAQGATAEQLVRGGVAATDYVLACQADAPGGLRYVLVAILPVR